MVHRPQLRLMTRDQRAFTCQHLGVARQQAQGLPGGGQCRRRICLGLLMRGLCKGAVAYDPSRGFRPSSDLVARVTGVTDAPHAQYRFCIHHLWC
jgi:hypothetical protein